MAEAGLAEAAAAVRAAGLRVSSLCRGGFFTVADPDGRRAARADNLAALAEAAELGTGTLVLVSGGLPPGQRDLGLARRMIADAIGSLVPEALRLGVRLGIEALHPMFCADRCVISSLGEAVDLALLFPADAVGVVVDTYHVWWDARLADEIARAGRRIVSFQVCDWVLPLPADTLLGRGHLGDGVIDFAPIAAAWRRPGTTATWRWRSSTRRSGTPRRTRPRRRSGSASPRFSAERPAGCSMERRASPPPSVSDSLIQPGSGCRGHGGCRAAGAAGRYERRSRSATATRVSPTRRAMLFGTTSHMFPAAIP